MSIFARFYLLFAIAAVLLIWFVASLLDLPESGPRAAVVITSVLVFGFICYLGNRQQGNPRA